MSPDIAFSGYFLHPNEDEFNPHVNKLLPRQIPSLTLKFVSTFGNCITAEGDLAFFKLHRSGERFLEPGIKTYKRRFDRDLKHIKIILSRERHQLPVKEWLSLVEETERAILNNPHDFFSDDVPPREIFCAAIAEVFKGFLRDQRFLALQTSKDFKIPSNPGQRISPNKTGRHRNGNMDNRSDGLNYEDQDANGQPVGLETSWTAASAASSGTFRVVLKHQPELKSATSDSSTGETDLDVTFDINVQ